MLGSGTLIPTVLPSLELTQKPLMYCLASVLTPTTVGDAKKSSHRGRLEGTVASVEDAMSESKIVTAPVPWVVRVFRSCSSTVEDHLASFLVVASYFCRLVMAM